MPPIEIDHLAFAIHALESGFSIYISGIRTSGYYTARDENSLLAVKSYYLYYSSNVKKQLFSRYITSWFSRSRAAAKIEIAEPELYNYLFTGNYEIGTKYGYRK